jgi:hypothetical protein
VAGEPAAADVDGETPRWLKDADTSRKGGAATFATAGTITTRRRHICLASMTLLDVDRRADVDTDRETLVPIGYGDGPGRA